MFRWVRFAHFSMRDRQIAPFRDISRRTIRPFGVPHNRREKSTDVPECSGGFVLQNRVSRLHAVACGCTNWVRFREADQTIQESPDAKIVILSVLAKDLAPNDKERRCFGVPQHDKAFSRARATLAVRDSG